MFQNRQRVCGQREESLNLVPLADSVESESDNATRAYPTASAFKNGSCFVISRFNRDDRKGKPKKKIIGVLVCISDCAKWRI